MADPARNYPDMEIARMTKEHSWLGWIFEEPVMAMAALRWKALQGDELPGGKGLHELRDALAQFGRAPIEEADARVQGLEKACRDIGLFVDIGLLSAPSEALVRIKAKLQARPCACEAEYFKGHHAFTCARCLDANAIEVVDGLIADLVNKTAHSDDERDEANYNNRMNDLELKDG